MPGTLEFTIDYLLFIIDYLLFIGELTFKKKLTDAGFLVPDA